LIGADFPLFLEARDLQYAAQAPATRRGLGDGNVAAVALTSAMICCAGAAHLMTVSEAIW
jgi:hypothetical protein